MPAVIQPEVGPIPTGNPGPVRSPAPVAPREDRATVLAVLDGFRKKLLADGRSYSDSTPDLRADRDR